MVPTTMSDIVTARSATTAGPYPLVADLDDGLIRAVRAEGRKANPATAADAAIAHGIAGHLGLFDGFDHLGLVTATVLLAL